MMKMVPNRNGNGNGNGNGANGLIFEFRKETARSLFCPYGPDCQESRVAFQTAEGVTLYGVPLHIARHVATFELFHPDIPLRLSEALNDFEITLQGRTLYSGRAVICNMVDAGAKMVFEASLCEDSWPQIELAMASIGNEKLHNEFGEFVRVWQKYYLVNRDYKTVIADLQTFLIDLRLWLEQMELGIRSSPAAERVKRESEIAHGLRDQVTTVLGNMFERFEAVSNEIEEDLKPHHRAFGRRQLHPLLLCSPFLHRIYMKPLGYAGDYEMMNMIVRNGFEGSNLFAKLLNAYILNQTPARAVRNRVDFLCNRILEQTRRVARLGRVARIFSIACGPAWEAVDFLIKFPEADQAQFHLLDSNGETLEYTGNKIDEIKNRYHRKTEVKLIKNSAQNLLRATGKPAGGQRGFDLIYCSGLYDYLSDSIIRALNTTLYDLLLPGGMLIVGNFAPCNPIRAFQEDLVDWFLIYRDGRQLASLAPSQASPDNCKIVAEPTGTHIFLEILKPK